ncbi:hypothetical protein [Nocardia niwae]|uniref:Uncharacterized protein n=1 Tax=Nocardia niwae TaxID=626084 RepID=A0ABV2X722_9NOCA
MPTDSKEQLVAEMNGWTTPSSDIADLRADITVEVDNRVRTALGPDADPAAVRVLRDLYAAALIDAGLGYTASLPGTANAGFFVLRLLRRRPPTTVGGEAVRRN